MTELKCAVPASEYHGQVGYDVELFRADLEQHRQFRINQLHELTAYASANDGAMAEVTSALVTAAATTLADVDAALRRIEDGCFGLCEGCNGAIPLDRLNALPMANLCMLCQHAKEASAPGHEQSTRRRSGVRTVPARPVRNPPPQPTLRELQRSDIVDVWGCGSFPASDPPANW